MDKNRVIYILSLLFIIMTSCDVNDLDFMDRKNTYNEVRIKDEYSEASYVFNEKVIDLREGHLEYIEEIIGDIIYYAPSTPLEILPPTGSILYSSITQKIPYGIANRVISRTRENGRIKLLTSPIGLNELFDYLNLESSYPITYLLGDEKGFYDEEGNFVEISVVDMDESFRQARSQKFKNTIGNTKLIEIPIKIQGKDSGVFANAKIQIGGIIKFVKNNDEFELSLEITIGITGEMGVRKQIVDNKTDFTPQLNTILNLIKKSTILKGILPVAGGLITLRPYIDLEANLVGQINGTLAVGYGYIFDYKCGWTQDGWFAENKSKEPKLEDIVNTVNIKGKGAIGPEFLIHLGCGLYTKDIALMLNLCPNIIASAELGFTGEISTNHWKINNDIINLTGSIDLEGEIIAKLFGVDRYIQRVKMARFELFKSSIHIFPELQPTSIIVSKSNDTPLTFGAKYNIEGGLLPLLSDYKVGIIIKESDSYIHSEFANKKIPPVGAEIFTYTLNNLAKDIEYTAIPCVSINGDIYEWEGIPFSSNKDKTDDILPPGFIPELNDLIPIYGGVDPPNIEGDYRISPFETVCCPDGYYQIGQIISDNIIHFFNQNETNNTIDFKDSQSNYSGSEGRGSFICGTGNTFTVLLKNFFWWESMYDNAWYNGTEVLIISGIKDGDCIKDLHYVITVLDKEDYYNYCMEIGAYRIFKDGDGITHPWKNQKSKSLKHSSSNMHSDNGLSCLHHNILQFKSKNRDIIKSIQSNK